MGELKIEKLTPTVGAEILDVDVERMLADDELPGLTLDALDAHGALVFRGLHIDDESQVAFSKRLGRVETFPGGPIPEILRVTLDPAKNKAAAYLKGTFDWHIDGLTEDVPIMATLLAAHAVAESGGETEFASSYDAFEALSDEEKERALATRVVHSLSAAAELADAGEDMLAMAKHRPAKGHPLVGRTRPAAGRWCSAPPRTTSSAWTPGRAGPTWTTCSSARRSPTGCIATSGRSVTW